ncbi:MAG: O-acetyl-ADP-ribose deacetylase [Bacteroidota bacterium]
MIDVVRADITTLAVDAIVNAANERLLGGGGVDGAIHRAAGPDLLAACRAIPVVRPGVRCPRGDVRITPGFCLPARYVIHTVGPIWRGGQDGEDDALASAYWNSASLARSHGVQTIAFPCISTGIYGFLPRRAARIAVDSLARWSADHALPERMRLVAFDSQAEQDLRDAIQRR